MDEDEAAANAAADAEAEATAIQAEAEAAQQEDQTADCPAGTGDSPAPTIAKPPAWKGSTAMDEIDRRQSTRRRIAREAKNMSPPLLGDTESLKEYAKDFRKKNEEYLDACFLIDYDLDRYKYAFRLACEALVDGLPSADEVKKIAANLFALADEEVDLNFNDREKMDKQRDEERKKLPPEPKDPNEVEGQLKIDGLKTKVRGDDGSVAEAASECTTRPLEEGEDVTEPNAPKTVDLMDALAASMEQVKAKKQDASTDANSVSQTTTDDAAQTADPVSSSLDGLDEIFAEEALTDEGAKPLAELMDTEAAKVERRKRRLAARRGAQ